MDSRKSIGRTMAQTLKPSTDVKDRGADYFPMGEDSDIPAYGLVNGDALDRSVMPAGSMDLLITSPPYNVGKAYGEADDTISYNKYLDFSKRWLENAYHWTRPTGRLCLNVSLDKNKQGKAPLTADLTTIAIKAGWKYHATILWLEGNISKGTAWGSWMSARAPHVIAPVETIIVLYKNEWRRDTQGESTITGNEFKDWVRGMWKFNGESGKRIGHEAPFPRELPRRCIHLFSFKDDAVLDPFAGSGTTLIEAINNGRRAHGIELSAEYYRLTKRRIKKECLASSI